MLDNGAMASPMMKLKGPPMAKHGPYPPAFPLKYALKDMRFALGLDAAAKLDGLPVSAAAAARYTKCDEEGKLGDSDFAAVMEAARGAV